jgi:DNA-binding transcriptional MerR regulator
MHTISQLGDLFRLSRSTLLYYDALGLLSPSLRSGVGYRLYSDEDRRRLQQICMFRDLGVPLKGIRTFLERKNDKVTPILLKRLLAINSEIDQLRDQQRSILGMIEAEGILKGSKPFLLRHRAIGREAGVTEKNYRSVHSIFQRAAPKEHRRFLKHLGFSDAEIRQFVKKNS